jgi:hypothetical protein
VSREWLVRLEQGHPRLEAQLVLDTLEAAGVALTTEETDSSPQDETEAAWDEVFSNLAERSPADEGPDAGRFSDG